MERSENVLCENVPTVNFYQRLKPERICFILSCDINGKLNGMVIGWVMPGSYATTVNVALRSNMYTQEIIKRTKEFVLVFPNLDQVHLIKVFGMQSGRNVDKFKDLNEKLTYLPDFSTPIMPKATANYAIKITPELFEKTTVIQGETFDHIHFFGKIIYAYDNPKRGTIYNIGKGNENSMLLPGQILYEGRILQEF